MGLRGAGERLAFATDKKLGNPTSNSVVYSGAVTKEW